MEIEILLKNVSFDDLTKIRSLFFENKWKIPVDQIINRAEYARMYRRCVKYNKPWDELTEEEKKEKQKVEVEKPEKQEKPEPSKWKTQREIEFALRKVGETFVIPDLNLPSEEIPSKTIQCSLLARKYKCLDGLRWTKAAPVSLPEKEESEQVPEPVQVPKESALVQVPEPVHMVPTPQPKTQGITVRDIPAPRTEYVPMKPTNVDPVPVKPATMFRRDDVVRQVCSPKRLMGNGRVKKVLADWIEVESQSGNLLRLPRDSLVLAE